MPLRAEKPIDPKQSMLHSKKKAFRSILEHHPVGLGHRPDAARVLAPFSLPLRQWPSHSRPIRTDLVSPMSTIRYRKRKK